MPSTTDSIKKETWYGRTRKRISRIFSRTSGEAIKEGEPVNEKETPQEKELRKTREEQEKIFEEFKTQTSLNVDADKLTNAIYNFQHYEKRLFETYGIYDGIKGVKDKNIGSSSKVRASFIVEHSRSILAGRIQGLESEFKLKTTQIEEIAEKIKEEKDFNDEINELNRTEHRNFSYWICVFYIIIGFFMMIADFPISLGISKYFIELPIESLDASFLDKIKNPEILLFSLGITLLSIYYKILYDEYINISPFRRRFRKEQLDKLGQLGDRFYAFLRLSIKLGILVAVIYLLYHIGEMRNALNPLSITPSDSIKSFVTEQQVFYFKLVSFIGVTILLPLLSGICLSVGFTVGSNRGNLKESNNRLRRLEESKRNIEVEKTKTETTKDMLECLRKEWDHKEIKLADLQQLFVNAYYQGYRQGHRNTFKYDIYENANSLFIDQMNGLN